MIQEHDRVVLDVDLPELGLKAGDPGTVVMVHRGSEAFEVEFMTLDGATIDVVTLASEQVRPILHGEIAHARHLQATGDWYDEETGLRVERYWSFRDQATGERYYHDIAQLPAERRRRLIQQYQCFVELLRPMRMEMANHLADRVDHGSRGDSPGDANHASSGMSEDRDLSVIQELFDTFASDIFSSVFMSS